MREKRYVTLDTRGTLKVGGPEARGFLQGLISNDIEKVAPERAIYTALLTPQGKYLHDFFVVELGEGLYLDCEAARLEELKRRLGVFRLRRRVTLDDASAALQSAVLFGEGAIEVFGLSAEPGRAKAFAGGLVYVDPRLAEAGLRALLPRDGAEPALIEAGFGEAALEEYERLRLTLGLPDGSRDLDVEKAIPLENGFDELNALDWNKGCYMGQELTARTKYRGLVRKRLMPVAIEGPVPAPGTPVMAGEAKAGEMRTGFEGIGLAMLRLHVVEETKDKPGALTAGEARLTPNKPAWAAF
jgi:folate-binding protein YgfZ